MYNFHKFADNTSFKTVIYEVLKLINYFGFLFDSFLFNIKMSHTYG